MKMNELFPRSNLEIVNNVKVTYDLCLSGVITRSNAIEELTKNQIKAQENYIKEDITKKIFSLKTNNNLRRPE